MNWIDPLGLITLVPNDITYSYVANGENVTEYKRIAIQKNMRIYKSGSTNLDILWACILNWINAPVVFMSSCGMHLLYSQQFHQHGQGHVAFWKIHHCFPLNANKKHRPNPKIRITRDMISGTTR